MAIISQFRMMASMFTAKKLLTLDLGVQDVGNERLRSCEHVEVLFAVQLEMLRAFDKRIRASSFL